MEINNLFFLKPSLLLLYLFPFCVENISLFYSDNLSPFMVHLFLSKSKKNKKNHMDPVLMLHQTRIEFSSMSSKIASKLSHLWVFHIQIIMGKPVEKEDSSSRARQHH